MRTLIKNSGLEKVGEAYSCSMGMGPPDSAGPAESVSSVWDSAACSK